MRGILVVARSILEAAAPEMQQRVVDFTDQGVVTMTRNVDASTTEIHLDHPDFDVEDGRYVLVMKSLRDPAQFMNRHFKITRLQRVDSAAGKFTTVKDY
jgi:hypothetical protein